MRGMPPELLVTALCGLTPNITVFRLDCDPGEISIQQGYQADVRGGAFGLRLTASTHSERHRDRRRVQGRHLVAKLGNPMELR